MTSCFYNDHDMIVSSLYFQPWSCCCIHG